MSAPKPGGSPPGGSNPGSANPGGSTYPVRDPKPATGKPLQPAVAAATSSGGSARAGAAADASKEPSRRLASIDALRGFDMFWIIGGQSLVIAAAVLVMVFLPKDAAWVTWLQDLKLSEQAKHADWVGFTAEDLIMPLFLFMVGVSMPFSFGKRLALGQSKLGIYWHIFVRVLVLWFFGMIAQGELLSCDRSKFLFFSNTLQAIAVGYLFAAIAVLHLPKIAQAIVAGLLMIGYWLLLLLVPFGTHEAGTMLPDANLALHIDKALLGWLDQVLLGREVLPDPHNYAWILPGMTFTATVLLGAMAGHVLRSERSEGMKVLWLLVWGAGCLAVGWLWCGGFGRLEQLDAMERVVPWFSPMNKHLWTSSMVLWAGGWSFLLMALFYLVIDVWRMRWAGAFFIVIGANAIFAYMLPRIVSFGHIASNLAGGAAREIRAHGMLEPGETPTMLSQAAGPAADLLVALVAFGVLWILLCYMYRKGTFLRV